MTNKLCEQDKDWIRGMVKCDDYADDIIKFIEKKEYKWVKE